MRSLRALVLTLLAGAAAFAFADEEKPALPPLPEGKVLCVVVPRDIKRWGGAEMDFQFADGQIVTVAQGGIFEAGWVLAKTELSGDGQEAVVTFRHGNSKSHCELRVPADRVAKNGTQRAPRPSVEVQYQVYELAPAAIEHVQRALDTAPGEDRLPLEMLKHALDGGAPPQMLTPPQFEVLSQFLAARQDVDFVDTSNTAMKSGTRTVFESVRGFRYPTEWENEAVAEPGPISFETRNCGVTLEIQATMKHGPLLRLEMIPDIVELLGAEDLDNGAIYPYKSTAERLPERAFNPLGKMPFTIARPSRYVFSARMERAIVDVPPGYGVLLTNLEETEKVAPFETAAPKGRLVVLVKADVAPE